MARWHGHSVPLVRRLAPVSPPRATRAVRVSFAALVRIKDDETYVLFDAGSRPGAFTPPGGVFKYLAPAADILDRLGFHGDRWVERGPGMRADLRGVLPARSVAEFCRWFDSGAYREDAVECLQREMVEELTEVGFPDIAEDVPATRFAHVRTVIEGPTAVLDKPYKQLRRFEFHDLVCSGHRAARLQERLVALAADPGVKTVLGVTATDIAHGRAGTALIAPHAAYLAGDSRTRPDLPPAR